MSCTDLMRGTLDLLTLRALRTGPNNGLGIAPSPGQTGAYNSFRLDRGVRTSQASLIVDPPDGRYPTRTDRVRESDAALNRAAALAALLLLAAGGSAAQPQPFLERVEVARVVIDVRVVDNDGQPIPGLTPEDFAVRIDEEPVRVETALWVGSDEAEGAAVEAVRAADAADSPDPESPGARVGGISRMLDNYYRPSPDPESPGARVGESGRLIVFVVQNSTRLLQSRVYGLLRLLRKSEGLLAAVTPSDRVAVLTFGFHLQIWVDFTDDLDRVRTLLAGEVRTGRPPVLEPRGEVSLLASLSQEQGREIFDIQEALRRIGEALEPLPGSKSVILIGHGFVSDTRVFGVNYFCRSTTIILAGALAVTPEAPGQLDGLQYRQIQIADLLEQLRGRGPGERFRQRVLPLPVLFLQLQERLHRVVPLLRPRSPVRGPTVPDPGFAGLAPLPVPCLPLRVRQRHTTILHRYVTDRGSGRPSDRGASVATDPPLGCRRHRCTRARWSATAERLPGAALPGSRTWASLPAGPQGLPARSATGSHPKGRSVAEDPRSGLTACG